MEKYMRKKTKNNCNQHIILDTLAICLFTGIFKYESWHRVELFSSRFHGFYFISKHADKKIIFIILYCFIFIQPFCRLSGLNGCSKARVCLPHCEFACEVWLDSFHSYTCMQIVYLLVSLVCITTFFNANHCKPGLLVWRIISHV